MPLTIIGPVSALYPAPTWPARIEVKPSWADDWQYVPECELITASTHASADDLDQLQLRRRYGRIKQPYQSALDDVDPVEWLNWWVRLSLVGDQGPAVCWTGRISGESRECFGAQPVRSGVQTFIAYGPQQLLRKIAVGFSVWDPAGIIGWVPDVNVRHRRAGLTGNRSASKMGRCYRYGGTDVWTHFDYLEYLLYWFIGLDLLPPDGPEWTLGGQVDILKRTTDFIRMEATQTVAEVLRRLVPRERGIDYGIVPTAAGFEIRVFALSAEEFAFRGFTWPKNPNTVRIRSGETLDNLRTTIVRTADHAYKTVRVLSQRIVACGSLYAQEGNLVGNWDQDLEDEYMAGTGDPDSTPDEHDKARSAPKFRSVYQLYGAPAAWDFSTWGIPNFDAEGKPMPGEVPDQQLVVRATLPWTPMREGWDYSESPPINNNPDDAEGDLLPPDVFLYHDAEQRYLSAEAAGVSVSVCRCDWGVWLSASPQHLLAAMTAFELEAEDTLQEPVYDPGFSIATVAFQTDQRIVLEQKNPDPAIDCGSLEIEARDCEFWYLAASTFLGYEPNGGLVFSPVEPQALRTDGERMLEVMAGAMSRYFAPRVRAEVMIQGFRAWAGLVGQILVAIEEGGDTHDVQGVITAVTWHGGEHPSTTIHAGYAR